MMPMIALRPGYEISRVIRGGWQLAGGHGPVDRAGTIADMIAFADAGIVTFDCADIYTGVEDLIGAFRTEYAHSRGADALSRVKVQTKCVPDLESLSTIGRDQVRRMIDTSLRRLRTDRLDLVQFHWWDYDIPRNVEVARWLDDLRRDGKIGHIGGTNFDAPRTLEIIDAGIPLVSMQVQYSLIDARPERHMVAVARQRDMHLFAFGSVAGGFLSDRWLGVAEPSEPLENRSLTKYKLIIDDFGGWDLFQSLLRALRRVADRHDTDIATIASAAMLARPGVAAVIVGARNRAHLAQNLRIASLSLTPQDLAELAAVGGRVPEGDCYTLERDRAGRHGRIIRYNLNKAS